MGFFEFFGLRNPFRKTPKPPSDGSIGKDFPGTQSAVSKTMKQGIQLWYNLYTDAPPWEDEQKNIYSSGLAGAIGRELASNATAEFSMSVNGGARAEWLNAQMQPVADNLCDYVEQGLCLGGVALRPYIENGQVIVEATWPTAFTPTAFDGSGKCVGAVFENEITYQKRKYVRLEAHGFETLENGERVYVIRNKAHKDSASGEEVALNTVPEWAGLTPELKVFNIDRPLFAYFKNPVKNKVDTDSKVGASIYAGPAVVKDLEQADKLWSEILWEFESGERKIFTDATKIDYSQTGHRLFAQGDWTSGGELFEQFSPEFRDEPLYRGWQRILQRLEFKTGLSYGSVSDPNTVELTATQVVANKNRVRRTCKPIQNGIQAMMDDLTYAINVFGWYHARELGVPNDDGYEIEYNFGDGVIDDPDTIRQDKAMAIQEMAAGVRADYEYRMEFMKEDEKTAKEMIAAIKRDGLVDDEQEEIGPVNG